MKLGINSYTFMWSIGFQGANPSFPDKIGMPAKPMTPNALLDMAVKLGVNLVQTGPNLGLDQLPPEQVDSFIAKAKEMSIELELGTRGLDQDHLIDQIDLAKLMGAKLIRTIPEIQGVYATDIHEVKAALSKILPVLEREDIKLAIENGRIPAENMRLMLDDLNHPYIGIVLDMVNSLAVPEGWKEVTRVLEPYVMCVHYKDFTIKRAWHMMGFICEGTPSGKGMIDIKWLFDHLQQSRHDFNVFVELWPPEQPSIDDTVAIEKAWAEESVNYLRNYIPG